MTSNNLLGFLALILPVSIGVGLSFVYLQKRELVVGEAIIISGICVFLSYPIFACALLLIQRSGLNPFHVHTIYFLFAFTLLIYTPLIFGKFKDNSRAHRLAKSTHCLSEAPFTSRLFLLTLLLALFYILTNYCLSLLPLAGWDALDYWAPEAMRLVEHSTLADGSAFRMGYIHPPTVSAIISWPAWVRVAFNIEFMDHFPWMLLMVAISLIVFGFAQIFTESLPISLLLAYFAVSLPLVENHVLVSGYADLWVAASVMATTVCLTMWARSQQVVWLLLTLTLAFLPIMFRNNGAFYSITILGAVLLFVAFKIWGRFGVIVVITAVCVLLVLLFQFGFELTMHDNNKFGVRVGDKKTILLLGYRRDTFAVQDWRVALRSIANAATINSSFGLLFSSALIVSIIIARSKNARLIIVSVAAASIPAALLLLFFSAQVVSPLFFEKYAQLHSDVGLSRFIMAWALAQLPLLIVSAPAFRDAQYYPAAKSPYS